MPAAVTTETIETLIPHRGRAETELRVVSDVVTFLITERDDGCRQLIISSLKWYCNHPLMSDKTKWFALLRVDKLNNNSSNSSGSSSGGEQQIGSRCKFIQMDFPESISLSAN